MFHQLAFAAAAAMYLVAAWNSTGYHSADEHFQLIAFAQWKLGELPAAQLAWEYSAGIRSTFQPWVAVVIFKVASFVGIQDPFLRAFLLRSLTALLAVVAIRRFVEVVSVAYSAPSKQAFIVLAYGLWFIPFLSVRFSSEGWSAIFLLLMATSVLSSERTTHWAIHAGLYAGLAMVCRPPTGAIVLSFVAWTAMVRKDSWKSGCSILLASAVVLVCSFVLDTAFYGRLTPSVWNYLRLGFVGDPTIQFDELPWYYYAPWIVKYAIPPIGATLVGALVLLVWKRPRHPLVWCMLPYVVIHSFIPHKELRFLYPLALWVPWLLMEAWSICSPRSVQVPKPLLWITATILITTNMFGLAVVLTSPAGEGRVRLAEELHRVSKPGDTIGYAVAPATAWRITLPDFYQPPGTYEMIVPTHALADNPDRLTYVVVQDGMPLPIAHDGLTLEPIARTETKWSTMLLRWYTWDEGQKPWTLYRVAPAFR